MVAGSQALNLWKIGDQVISSSAVLFLRDGCILFSKYSIRCFFYGAIFLFFLDFQFRPMVFLAIPGAVTRIVKVLLCSHMDDRSPRIELWG